MASEQLHFDIVADNSSASRAFKDTADTAVLAAKGAKLLSDSLKKQEKAALEAAAANKVLKDTDKTLSDAQLLLAGNTAVASKELKKHGGKGGASGRIT